MKFFLIGLAVGFVVVSVGVIVDYVRYFHRNTPHNGGKPVAMIRSAVVMGVLGVITLTLSFFLAGGLRAAVIMGLGAIVGFYLGFILRMAVWIAHAARQ